MNWNFLEAKETNSPLVDYCYKLISFSSRLNLQFVLLHLWKQLVFTSACVLKEYRLGKFPTLFTPYVASPICNDAGERLEKTCGYCTLRCMLSHFSQRYWLCDIPSPKRFNIQDSLLHQQCPHRNEFWDIIIHYLYIYKHGRYLKLRWVECVHSEVKWYYYLIYSVGEGKKGRRSLSGADWCIPVISLHHSEDNLKISGIDKNMQFRKQALMKSMRCCSLGFSICRYRRVFLSPISLHFIV